MSTPAEELLRVYGAATLVRIARTNQLPASDAVAELTELWKDKAKRRKCVEGLDEASLGLLAFADQIGRRLRGERLKKRWFLHGYDTFDAAITPLVERGIMLVGNLAAREPVSMETALDQGILQQWLQVTPGFEGLAGEPPPAREVVEQVSDETTIELQRRMLVLEFNLLGAVRFLEQNKIRLNRDGSPHRSDLKALAPLIIDRPTGRADTIPDPNAYDGWDLLVFILSVATAFGMVERRADVLVASGTGRDYFMRPLAERLPVMLRAIEQQRAWSELDATQWHANEEPPVTGHGAGGFLVEGGPGATLAGPRGSVISALRRLSPHDWFDVDETVNTIAHLEHAYLSTALPIVSGDDASVKAFVQGVICLTLTHVGCVELGRGSNGGRRARLTPIGRAFVGLGECPDEPTGKGAILVEPNFEITGFLDLASLRLLYDLSRFAELTRTSERVVRYRLHGEYVQWGYARGYTADGISSILTNFSAQPVPPAVNFALQDWERLHRRVTVMLCGDIVASSGRSDPEVIQSGVAFAIENDDDVEVIDAVHTFVVYGHAEIMERALTAHKPRLINYEGGIVPSLYWVDPETLRAPTGSTDFRTLAALQPFCTQIDDETYRIDAEKVVAHGGATAGFDALLTILRAGMVGGLAPERELSLKRMVGTPAEGCIERIDVLIVTSAEDGDRLAKMPAVREFVAQRLGPRAFQVIPGMTTQIVEVLTEAGVDVELT